MPSLSEIALSVIAAVALGYGIVSGIQMLRKRRWSKEQTCLEFIRQYFQPLNLQELVTVSRVFPIRVRADLQLALNEALKQIGTIEHFSGMRKEYAIEGIEFNAMFSQSHHPILRATAQYDEIDIGTDVPVRCLVNGLWLLRGGGAKFGVLMARAEQHGQVKGVRIEIACPLGAEGERLSHLLFKHLEEGIARAGSYRGKVLSLEEADMYSGQSRGITVHRLRSVKRDEIILPARTLDLIDRNIIRFVEQRPKLAALKLSVKKGILFYGPPGTGKTHTLHYLVEALKGHTFLLIAAEQQAFLSEYITLARLLQPSVVVIEDADLIARSRDEASSPCTESLLNKLLNEMDGLRMDAQILFVLTTNRPESLEEALASRPGRIDQAIEFPLPDEPNREKLVRMYAQGLKISDVLIHDIVARTAGVSASFIKELVRRAAQYALENGRTDALAERDVEDALQELLHHGGQWNAKLLGARVIA